MKIAVVGAGAIGGWVAANLSLAGEKVMAVARNGALDEVGIIEGGHRRATRMTRFDGPADLLVLAVKAPSLAAAATWSSRMVGPDTLIVPMLNGVPWWFVDAIRLDTVDPDASIAASLPLSQVIGCVVHASCRREEGNVIVNHADKLIIGQPDGQVSEGLTSLVALFEGAGIKTDATTNVRQAIWYKLWGNATINPLSALTRVTCDKILADRECRQWMLEGMSELAEVGAAIGCPISQSGEDRMAVTARLGAFKTSMLQDVEAGRTIELEALLGAPREIARACAVQTPALDRLYAVTRLLGEGLGIL